MTHNWNTLTPMPKSTNDFGQPLLDDYGQDDLFPYFVDFHGNVDPASVDRITLDLDRIMDEGERYSSEPTGAPKRTGAQIVALIDPNEAAMLVKDDDEAIEPDFVESDMAWWIGAEATVGCPLAMSASVKHNAMRGGWQARVGNYPSHCGFVVMPHGDLPASVVSTNAEQHSLWSLVRSTILADA